MTIKHIQRNLKMKEVIRPKNKKVFKNRRKKILTDDEIHQIQKLKRAELIFVCLVFIIAISPIFYIMFFPRAWLFMMMGNCFILLAYHVWQTHTFKNAPKFEDYKDIYRLIRPF